jgi:ribosome maturation factor RimP
MSISERVRAVIEPIVASQDLELFDLEQAGSIVRVTIDRPGGVDVEAITSTTRALSRALDEHDPIAGNYTLEVSSPGLERALRTPRHWEWAANRQVAIKTMPNYAAGRRFVGTVTASNDSNVTVVLDEPVGESITIDYSDIEKARTIFVWAATPKPGGPKNQPKVETKKKKSTKEDSMKEDKVQPC